MVVTVHNIHKLSTLPKNLRHIPTVSTKQSIISDKHPPVTSLQKKYASQKSVKNNLLLSLSFGLTNISIKNGHMAFH